MIDIDSLETLSIEELRQRTKIKKYLAKEIQNKARKAGFNLSISSIYYTFRNPNNYCAEIIKRSLISIIREQEEKLEAIA